MLLRGDIDERAGRDHAASRKHAAVVPERGRRIHFQILTIKVRY
jgi:hypothetical protein